jgi:hypothetical protein
VQVDTNNENWGVKEWRAYALFLEKVHQKALDGWAASVDELEQHSKLLRKYDELVSQLQNQVVFSDALKKTKEEINVPKKKKRGRPEKDASTMSDLDLFSSMNADYMAEHPGSAPSDKEVIEWCVKQTLAKYGLRASRVYEKSVQAKIKTLRNRISEARNPGLPKKSR